MDVRRCLGREAHGGVVVPRGPARVHGGEENVEGGEFKGLR